jgi:endosialidase-like protein
MNLGDRGTVARIIATIRIILSLSHEEEKSQNPVHMKTKTLSVVLLLLVAYFSALPTSQAVSPPPDGDYPGGNTAEGQNALLGLTTGTYNTAAGWFSLQSNLTGNLNTGIGAGTLLVNTADNNTATGAGALLNNSTGSSNTAGGVFALFDNTTGGSNTATGFATLGNNSTGSFNTANGANALLGNTTGAKNTGLGYQALLNNITGQNNTGTGYNALLNNTNGFGNTGTGFQALQSNTTGNANTAYGANALLGDSTGGGNTAIGNGALLKNTTGDSNTALGISAGVNVTTGTNIICIGSEGANVNNSCFIGNIRGVTTANTDAVPVLIDSAGQLGTTSSSRRFKKEIKPMNNASEVLLGLKPVVFHYKSDNTNTPQFGLIAEEVAAVNPDLVVRDQNGEIYTVRYEAVNAMLLNEFLKEHRKVEELSSTVAAKLTTIVDLKSRVAQQQKGMEVLTARLNEQAAQIQKVSAQLEASKPGPRTVLNDR